MPSTSSTLVITYSNFHSYEECSLLRMSILSVRITFRRKGMDRRLWFESGMEGICPGFKVEKEEVGLLGDLLF